MPTPVLIGPPPPANPNAVIVTQGDSTALAGPFLSSNGNYYQIVCTRDNITDAADIGLAKSTDGGNTYPTIVTVAGVTAASYLDTSVWYPGTGEDIHILYAVTTAPSVLGFRTVICTMNTETFGTPNPTPLSNAVTNIFDWLITVNGAGEQVVVYDIEVGADVSADVWMIRYTLGAWSAPLKLSSQTLSYLDQVLIDGNGHVRTLWSDWQAGGPAASVKRNAMYETEVNGGTIVATYTAFANANDVNNKGYGDHNVKPGIYDAFHDALVWPICKQTLDGGGNVVAFGVGILVCSNANTFPSYTYESAWTAVVPSYVIGWPSLANKAVGHEISLLWPEDARPDPRLPNGLTLRRVTASAVHGVWSVLTTFYDPAVDAPNPAPTWGGGEVMFFTWSRYVGASESFAANTCFTVGGVDGFSPYNFPIVVPVTQTLQLIKQVSGGSAVPTDFTLSAAGPTPISGAGGVGPSTVDPGTYTLSETSVVDYTAGTWLCTGGTQAGNQVTIASGQTVVCTIANTFSGIVPPPPPDTCIIFEPATPSPSLVVYDEPLELKGS